MSAEQIQKVDECVEVIIRMERFLKDGIGNPEFITSRRNDYYWAAKTLILCCPEFESFLINNLKNLNNEC